MEKTKKIVALRFPLELYQALREQANEGNRTLPSYIRPILTRYVDNLAQQNGRTDPWLNIR